MSKNEWFCIQLLKSFNFINQLKIRDWLKKQITNFMKKNNDRIKNSLYWTCNPFEKNLLNLNAFETFAPEIRDFSLSTDSECIKWSPKAVCNHANPKLQLPGINNLSLTNKSRQWNILEVL